MAVEKTKPTLSALVARGHQLRQEIEDRQAELETVSAGLVKLGAGRYVDEAGKKATVVSASAQSQGAASYNLRPEDLEKARTLAGDQFGELFERTVIYTPKTGFADRADAVLTEAKKKALVAMCFVAGKLTAAKAAYVTWK
jgi:predicted transcriptional regulator